MPGEWSKKWPGNRLRNGAWVLFTTTLLLTTQACSRQADSESASQQVTLEDLQDSVSHLTRQIAAYSFDQRDQALDSARKELEAIDARIDALAREAEIESQELSSDVRKQQAALLRQLRQRRTQVSEMTERLSRSSAGAWEEIRDGLSNAYGELDQALDNARAEFADSDG